MFRKKPCRAHINKVNSLIVDTFQFPLQLEPQDAIRVLQVMAMEDLSHCQLLSHSEVRISVLDMHPQELLSFLQNPS